MNDTHATDGSARAAAAAILRAAAALIEARPDIPLPGTDISFFVRGQDTPATIAAIASALPCDTWQASISRNGEYEWLRLNSGNSQARGTCVRITAPAADACTAAGTKTVTVWQAAAALAALAGTSELGEAT